MKADKLKLVAGEKKEITFDEVLDYLVDMKDKLRNSETFDEATSISINFAGSDLLKKIQKRMAKKKLKRMNDYVALLIAEDLDSGRNIFSEENC